MKSQHNTIYRLLIFFIFSFLTTVSAQLQLPQIFNSGAVFQRDVPIPVWGTSYPADTVIVSLNSVSDTTIADTVGNWQLSLPALSAGGPYSLTFVYGSGIRTYNDIYVGDVWIASGQSNMEMTVSQVDSAAFVISSANDQMLRQFKITKGLANEPSNTLPGGCVWRPATPSYVGNFTAVGYFCAKELRQHVNIPIGIINTSYGGSRIETWMSEDMLGYDEQDTVLANGEPERQPTVAYNKMIHPILNIPVKGFFWYQGESNADNMEDALGYRFLFQTMISGWRQIWNLGDIPFLWVQLPNFGQVYSQPQLWDAWPQLRDGQSAALVLPNTGEAVTIDVGATDIHPTNKKPVGKRLSLVTRKVAYGENIVYSGPRYKSNILRDDGKIAIQFNHLGSGLVTIPDAVDTVKGFAVADINGNLAWASAVLDSNQVLVWSDQMADPVRVRYAWEYNPKPINLYNAEQLPAAPFYVDINPGFGITTFKAGRYIIEHGQSTTLTWMVYGSDNISLDGSPVDSSNTIVITPDSTHTYQLIAVNRDSLSEIDTATVTIEVLDPNQINRALNHPAKASTLESISGSELLAEYAVDGDFQTRWSSAWDPSDPNTDDNPDDEWISVDFGESIDIERVILFWETAFGRAYNIEVSYDGYLWQTVFEEDSSDGGEDNIVFTDTTSGRFIRIHGQQRATQWGYSLWETAAYGFLSAKKPPEITLLTTKGNIINPSDSLTIIADATDTDGTIEQVSFYVDGVLLATDTIPPFKTPWQSGGDSSNIYSLTAIAMDNDLLIVQSDTFKVYIKDSTFATFEAEEAIVTGQATRRNSSVCSGGAYMDLTQNWTITWDNIGCPTTGEYLMSIGYRLNYESPKSQYLVVNGDTIDIVEFTAPNTSIWLQKGFMVNLVQGTNSIALHGFWNWMSLDFIAVKGATIISSLQDNPDPKIPKKFGLYQNYPNPFNPVTTIKYQLPRASNVKLEIFNVLGQKIKTLVDSQKAADYYNVKWNGENESGAQVSTGVYVYRYSAEAIDGSIKYEKNQKMILLR